MTVNIILFFYAGRAPKTVKIFINQPHILGFDEAERNYPVQELRYSATAN